MCELWQIRYMSRSLRITVLLLVATVEQLYEVTLNSALVLRCKTSSEADVFVNCGRLRFCFSCSLGPH